MSFEEIDLAASAMRDAVQMLEKAIDMARFQEREDLRRFYLNHKDCPGAEAESIIHLFDLVESNLELEMIHSLPRIWENVACHFENLGQGMYDITGIGERLGNMVLGKEPEDALDQAILDSLEHKLAIDRKGIWKIAHNMPKERETEEESAGPQM